MTSGRENVDAAEVAKFDALASRWWDPNGEFRPLHEINPLRLDWIRKYVELDGRRALDVGCGGGILTESMAAAGAHVTGIDMAEGPLQVARLHQIESGAKVEYRQATAEELAAEHAGQFDVVTCLEMLEHVPSPPQVIGSVTELVKPGGHVFFSTINRNPKSFLFAIVGAEYVLRLLPAGTHEYQKFIRPSELESWSRKAGLQLQSSVGLLYNPFTQKYSLGSNVDVNYLMYFRRPEAE
ncbi:MAG: bifunctional 2-polyprenyl-6-hydroxyphenol methylase/3-demethylubiquinol 3-O-methyltransferase UbiG [Gammaproteobacteria bacterium]|nr:bifunctional 2-polyprenyl-6-hydroxyphenol methylase/3-demethylubiquinol 3-O-methyltransferase UbiG [Gammaproteobacteria bacterium]MDH3408803.1 bifunctional 2-polyprenyl-6-hydroxyphenol methylase/3-demethylubiquinol 3-O-methyltransferase UbiG [Gammaproteobacteria bacterium]MDH3552028.1 bifunctional 2-polyprenyl-6-hydroxyphenol methylase/3-demethylubiquinol 3-O-methyltransferase UbiG [Gammaproteobacteria bacterium]